MLIITSFCFVPRQAHDTPTESLHDTICTYVSFQQWSSGGTLQANDSQIKNYQINRKRDWRIVCQSPFTLLIVSHGRCTRTLDANTPRLRLARGLDLSAVVAVAVAVQHEWRTAGLNQWSFVSTETMSYTQEYGLIQYLIWLENGHRYTGTSGPCTKTGNNRIALWNKQSENNTQKRSHKSEYMSNANAFKSCNYSMGLPPKWA